VNLELQSHSGQQVAEGSPGLMLLDNASAVSDLIEFCFNNRVKRILLCSDNLSTAFFDLKSGMARSVLEKCRQYRLRVAIVLNPGLELGTRFRELMTEENKRSYVRFCLTSEEARDWLSSE
jgi:Domain of unknown function (DUF4180)